MNFNKKFLMFYGFLCLLITLSSCNSAAVTYPTLGSPEVVPDSSNVASPYAVGSSNPSSTSITLFWSSSPSANYFEIHRSTESGGTYEQIGENNTNSFVDTTVSPGTYYYYKVKALWRSSVNTANIVTGGFSNWYRGNTILDTPQNVSASEDNTSQVAVTWLSVTGASSYKIYRALYSSSSYTLIKSDQTDLLYNDTTAVAPNIYKYQVSAVASSAIESNNSSYDTGYICSDAPTNIIASDGLYFSTIKITWNTASNFPVRYQIYRSKNSGAYSYLATTSTSAANYSDTSAIYGNTYEYKIKAEYSGGALSVLSASDSGYLRNPAETVQYSISWTPNRESAVNKAGGGYKLYYSQTSNFDINTAIVMDVPYSSGTHSPVVTTVTLSHGTWYFKVTAYSSLNGFSSNTPSNEISVFIE